MDELKINVNKHMRDIQKSSSYVSISYVKSVKGNGIKHYYYREKGHKLDEYPKLKKKTLMLSLKLTIKWETWINLKNLSRI